MAMQIKDIGGTVHYSDEFRAYLSRLPREEATRVVAAIEYKNRPRKIIVDDGKPPVAVWLEKPSTFT